MGEFCTHEVEVPLCTWVYPVLGIFEDVPEATACTKEDVQKALTVLNNHLLHNMYMVGHSITLADISVCCALLDGMKLVLDEGLRKKFGNLMRWFNHCLSHLCQCFVPKAYCRAPIGSTSRTYNS